MKTPLFVFLGVVENGTDANIGTLKIRLENYFSNMIEELKLTLHPNLIFHFGRSSSYVC
jgi:hypothetical protein